MRIEPWHWWVLGGLLVLLEAVAPGFVLIWLGTAALATGGVLWLVPDLAWPWQITLFSLLNLVGAGVWLARRRLRVGAAAADEHALNRRAESHIGRIVHLVEPILDGRGKVRIGDTVWLASGPDLPAGRRVKIVAARGTLLEVQPVEDDP
ncbi:MAG: NfeD family protein [Geminicoccaceae bacterium]|nr:NfeD family protein [Geminicoccaceae bacterium]